MPIFSQKECIQTDKENEPDSLQKHLFTALPTRSLIYIGISLTRLILISGVPAVKSWSAGHILL